MLVTSDKRWTKNHPNTGIAHTAVRAIVSEEPVIRPGSAVYRTDTSTKGVGFSSWKNSGVPFCWQALCCTSYRHGSCSSPNNDVWRWNLVNRCTPLRTPCKPRCSRVVPLLRGHNARTSRFQEPSQWLHLRYV